jgi:hypothetical protein
MTEPEQLNVYRVGIGSECGSHFCIYLQHAYVKARSREHALELILADDASDQWLRKPTLNDIDLEGPANTPGVFGHFYDSDY